MTQKITFLAASLLAIATALPAQSIKAVRSGFEFAQFEIDQKRVETAAKALREAYALLKILPAREKSKDRAVEKDVLTLLKKIDPKGKKLVEVQVKAAKDLQRSAAGYVKNGWRDTALELLLQAQKLNPELVAADIKDLRKTLTAVGKRFETAGPNKDLLSWFHLGERPGLNRSPWISSNFGIMAPKTDKKGGPPILISNKKLSGNVRIKIDIKPGPSGSATFFWNYRRELQKNRFRVDYCAVELDPRTLHVSVTESENSRDQAVAEGTLIMDSFKNQWIPLEIEIKGKSVTVKIPKNDPIKFDSYDLNKGHLGFGFETESRSNPQAQFRHLVIEYLD